jgi:CheY-like chemotaxis protein
MILIVDDDDFNSYTLKELIKLNFSIECDTAKHGQQAVDKVRQRGL